MMQLGAEGVFVGSGIFKSEDPQKRAQRHRQGGHQLQGRGRARRGLASGLGEAMPGIDAARMPDEAKIQHRGW